LHTLEGGIFGIAAGRYSGDINLDLFLKGHAGEDYRVDRQGRPPAHIPNATLTMGLAVQPDVLTSLAHHPSFRGRGFLARVLFALPIHQVGTRFYQDRPISRAATDAYATALQTVLQLPKASSPSEPGKRHTLRLEGEAKEVWKCFHDAIERRMADGRDLAGIRDWASKLPGAVARIAGGLHMIEHAGQGTPGW